MSPSVMIIDYGVNNIWSLISALNFLGIKYKISQNYKEIANAEMIILPGIGSFFQAISRLNALHINDAVNEAILGRGVKILGICLGMQLMSESSTEGGVSIGLNLIPGITTQFNGKLCEGLKIPHIGFNEVSIKSDSILHRGIKNSSDFYFVHSYRILCPSKKGAIIGACVYGETFLASYENENIFATQFHPEKSQTNGLKLIENFYKY